MSLGGIINTGYNCVCHAGGQMLHINGIIVHISKLISITYKVHACIPHRFWLILHVKVVSLMEKPMFLFPWDTRAW